MYREKAL